MLAAVQGCRQAAPCCWLQASSSRGGGCHAGLCQGTGMQAGQQRGWLRLRARELWERVAAESYAKEGMAAVKEGRLLLCSALLGASRQQQQSASPGCLHPHQLLLTMDWHAV
jgi:hypothetical protein